jgi:uncharacterized membrane-anchored protein
MRLNSTIYSTIYNLVLFLLVQISAQGEVLNRITCNDCANIFDMSLSQEVNICAGDEAVLIASEGALYNWSTGDTEGTITVMPQQNTSYTVTITNSQGKTKIESFNVIVNPTPEINLTCKQKICQGETIRISASGGTQYRWSTGARTQSILVTPNATRMYSVTVTNEFGCTAKEHISVVVNENPTATITGTDEICLGETTRLFGEGDGDFLWSTGETTTEIDVTPTETTSYSLTVTNVHGCTDVASFTVNVQKVNASIDPPQADICLGDELLLIASGGDFYEWNTGATSAGIIVNPTETTTYTVTVTNEFGCSDVASVELIVNPNPEAAIEGETEICLGESTTLTATGGTEYLWNTGETTAVITVSPAETTTYTVTVTNEFGCSDVASVELIVNPNPEAAIEGETEICLGESTTLTATGGTEYLWNTGETTAVITVSPEETTTYTVTVTNEFGCTDAASVELIVNPNPEAAIEGETEICLGESTTLTASGGISYLWNTGETTAVITVSPEETTTYTVTVTNEFGCTDVASVELIVHPNPEAAIEGETEICLGESTTLTASGGISYLWNTGETTAVITVSPEETTTYTVTVTNEFGCTDAASVELIVHPNPEAAIEGETEICLGESTTLTASGGISYLWNTGETTAVITVSPEETTTYTVTVTNEFGCTDAASVELIVHPNPEAAIEGETEICLGESTTLTASGGMSYLWNTGETTAVITVSPEETTTYTVTVTNEFGCTDVASVELIVHPNPEAAIEGETEICLGENTTLTASGGMSYLWNTGEDTAEIKVNPAETTTYTVTVTNEFGCTDVASVEVIVNPNPEAAIEGETEICLGESTTLTASGGMSYLWNTGDDTAEITVSPAETTTYKVTVTNEFGCSDVASVEVIVNPNPEAAIEGETEICLGESTTLTASGGMSYLWSTGETTAVITVSPEETTTYTVTVTNDAGCESEASIEVVVNPIPMIKLICVHFLCEGESATLEVVGGETVEWSTGSTDRIIIVTPTETTSYSVTITDENGCSNSESVTIEVAPNPEAQIEGETEICLGESTILTASGGDFYEWSTGEETASIEVSPTETSTYTVTVTDLSGCSSEATVEVQVNENPEAAIEGETEICLGESTILTASGGDFYEWSTGEETASIEVSPTETSTYTVTVTDLSGCSSEATVEVQVNENPEAAIEGETEICLGESTILTASGGDFYEWSTGEETASIKVSPTETTTYTVTVTNDAGCESEASIEVVVNPIPMIKLICVHFLCEGESATLEVVGGETVEWSTGSTDRIIIVTPTETTSYSVTITDENGCSNSESVTIEVAPNPEAQIEGETEICLGESTILTASGGDFYEWSTGEETASIEVSPTETSTYTVTVTDLSGCSSEATVEVQVNENPEAAIEGETEVCLSESTTLTASGGMSYLWSTGETTAVITVSPEETTTYTVTVTNDAGCESEASIEVVVNPIPNSTIEGMDVICEGNSTTLSIIESGSYLWSNGSVDSSIDVSPAESTTYSVTVTNDSGCSSESSILITVNSKPIANISGNTSLCQGSATMLTASGGLTYLWSTGSNQSSIIIAPSENTEYSVTVTNEDGCTDEASVTVVVHDLPTIIITGDDEICIGESTTLVASGGVSYVWSNGVFTSENTVSPTETSTYTVALLDENNCTASGSFTVVVNPLPSVTISGTTRICVEELTTLTAEGGVSYLWSTGETTDFIIVGPFTSTIYSVTATSEAGCQNEESVLVEVFDFPIPEIIGDFEICEGGEANLTVSGGAFYLWDTGETTESITVSPFETTIYSVTVSNEEGCNAVAEFEVLVYENPVAEITGSSFVCEGSSIVLTASGGEEYLWSTGSTTTSINVSPEMATLYRVTVTRDANCIDVAEFEVEVKPTPNVMLNSVTEICEGDPSSFVVATGSTPNTCDDVCEVTESETLVYWDLQNCRSVMADGSHVDYSEFGPTSIVEHLCVSIDASNVYRLPGLMHSCNSGPEVEGNEDNIAMCIGTQETCSPSKLDYSQSLRFEVDVDPVASFQITGLQFFEQSPERFSWLNGPQNELNDYASKYLIRVSKDGEYIYYEDNIPTNSEWTIQNFDFSDNDNFKVTGEASFLFELIPYCRQDNNGQASVWDIDEIKIFGGCCEGAQDAINNYAWSNGDTGMSLDVSPSETTTYVVTVTDCCGCSASNEFTIHVSNFEEGLGDDIEIELGETVTLTPDLSGLSSCGGNPGDNASFLWSNGSTNASIVVSPNTTTTYAVSITDCNECEFVESIVVLVAHNAQVLIYPNPAIDRFHLSTTKEINLERAQVTLHSMDNRSTMYRVQNQDITYSGASTIVLPESLPEGVYLVEIVLDEQRFVEKLVLIRK